MNILVCVNNNYVNPLLVMLTSLFKTNKKQQLKIYLIYSNISKSNINRINQLVNYYDNILVPIHIHEEIEKLPTRAFSAETYYRLYAFHYLPNEVEKILFLDPDMIIRKPLNNLYEIDMGECFYAAAPDKEDTQVIKTRKIFSLSNKYKYVNSGVELINITLLRKNVNKEQLSDFIINNANRLPYLDQDVLNCLYYNKIKYIDTKFNYDCRYINKNFSSKVYCMITDFIRLKKIYVLHYKGSSKPWRMEYTGRFRREYYKYIKLMKKNMKQIRHKGGGLFENHFGRR